MILLKFNFWNKSLIYVFDFISIKIFIILFFSKFFIFNKRIFIIDIINLLLLLLLLFLSSVKLDFICFNKFIIICFDKELLVDKYFL